MNGQTRTMPLTALTMDDAGKVLTIILPEVWMVTGTLHQITHDQEWIEEQALCDVEPRRTPTRLLTRLIVGPFEATIYGAAHATVRIHEPRP